MTNDDIDDLIKRLRYFTFPNCIEAADALERLNARLENEIDNVTLKETEIARLKAEWDAAIDKFDLARKLMKPFEGPLHHTTREKIAELGFDLNMIRCFLSQTDDIASQTS